MALLKQFLTLLFSVGVCGAVVLFANGAWSFCYRLDNLSETSLSADYRNTQISQSALPATHQQWEYQSGSDSDIDRPDPDLVLDDLASRRFHTPSPAPPTNYAVPISPLAAGNARGRGGSWPNLSMSPNVALQQNVTCLRSENTKLPCDLMCLPEQTRLLPHPQFAWLIKTMRILFGLAASNSAKSRFACFYLYGFEFQLQCVIICSIWSTWATGSDLSLQHCFSNLFWPL